MCYGIAATLLRPPPLILDDNLGGGVHELVAKLHLMAYSLWTQLSGRIDGHCRDEDLLSLTLEYILPKPDL